MDISPRKLGHKLKVTHPCPFGSHDFDRTVPLFEATGSRCGSSKPVDCTVQLAPVEGAI